MKTLLRYYSLLDTFLAVVSITSLMSIIALLDKSTNTVWPEPTATTILIRLISDSFYLNCYLIQDKYKTLEKLPAAWLLFILITTITILFGDGNGSSSVLFRKANDLKAFDANYTGLIGFLALLSYLCHFARFPIPILILRRAAKALKQKINEM